MSGARPRAAPRRGTPASRPARNAAAAPKGKSSALARMPRPPRHWLWVAALVAAFFIGVPVVHALMGEIAALGLLVFLAGFAAGRLSIRI
jgi:hypothetical protein